jgi:hypothetical protein
VLYDLAQGPPEPGTLLESVFLLVSLRRREAELLHTEAIVTAIACLEGKDFKLAVDAIQALKNTLFPFLEAEKKKLDDKEKAALKYWTQNIKFKVKPLWNANQDRKLHSQLKRSAEKTKQAEELRKRKRHTSI